MQRSTCWVIGAPLMRQVHSLPLAPYHTRKASPERSGRISHLRIERVSFIACLALIDEPPGPRPIHLGVLRSLAPICPSDAELCDLPRQHQRQIRPQ
jgi:hypothetical protein